MGVSKSIRTSDKMGRIVIPQEIRKELGVDEETPFEMEVENGTIILRVVSPRLRNTFERLIDGLSRAGQVEMEKRAREIYRDYKREGLS